jgi:NAD+ diphosphatase
MSLLAGDDVALLVVLRDFEVLVSHASGAPSLPSPAELGSLLESAAPRHPLGAFAAGQAYGLVAAEDAPLLPEHSFVPVRSLFGVLDEPTLDWIGRALAIVEFETTHRFCGRCGAPTEPVSGERAKRCSACELSFYPRIPPAVITLVERDGKLLLARSARFKAGMFSAVAGFVEVGESLEQAAIREVHEEVGVVVGDLRYFGSQPWPFGRSLMVGYFARHLSGEIAVDGNEIVEADWFDLERLPLLPPPISIARKLIEAFLAEHRPQL